MESIDGLHNFSALLKSSFCAILSTPVSAHLNQHGLSVQIKGGIAPRYSSRPDFAESDRERVSNPNIRKA